MATFDGLTTDRDLVDSLRARAWAENAPGLRDRIRFDPNEDRFVGVPSGCPQGVDGEDYVRSYLAPSREALLAQIDGDGAAGHQGEQPSESVRALRAMLGA